MSIRYLNEFSEVATVDSMEKLFDPRVNRAFPPINSAQELYWASMKKTLDTLFCKENVENYSFCRHFMFNGTMLDEAEWLFFKDITKDVPLEHRYLFSMFRRDRLLHSEHGRIQLLDGTQHRDIGSSYLSYEGKWSYVSLNGMTSEQFATKIKETHEKFDTEVFQRCRNTTEWPSSCVYAPSNLVKYYLYYTAGSDIFVTNGRTGNAYKTLKRILDGAELRITITGRNVELHLVQTVSRTNRSPIHQLLNYTTDVLTLLPFPNMEKKEKDPILVGVELECCTDYDVKELVDAAEDPFFLAKSDSSISGSKNNRMELVTAPSSFKYLKRQYALWFNKLDYTKFDVTTQTENGMHVHIGRTHFEDDTHIRNFCWFYHNPANLEFLVSVSERTQADLMRWSPTYQFSSRTRTKAFKEAYKIVSNNHRGITNFKGGWEGAKTVEIRMFKGIVSYAAIVKNLEFIEATFHFTKGLMSYRDLTLRGFLKWLDRQPRNKYILLRKFIDGIKSMDRILLAADIKDTIFNVTDQHKVARLLMGASFKVTNEHITYLNKRAKKRVYTLNKETGEITVHQPNVSKLQAFDKSFAERYTRHIPTAA